MSRYLVILSALAFIVGGSPGVAAEPEEQIEDFLGQTKLGVSLDECTETHGLIGCMEMACRGMNFEHKICRRYFENGQPKIVRACTYPLTGIGVVTTVFTDLAVIDVTENGLEVREMVAGISFEELEARTGTALTLRPNWRPLTAPNQGCA